MKEQFKQLKEEAEKNKNENGEKKENSEKQPLGKVILGWLILIAIIALMIFVFITNMDTLFLPKNSVTIDVVDQNEEPIDNLVIEFIGDGKSYTVDYSTDGVSNITTVDVKPGDYKLYFRDVPEGYTCPTEMKKFTLNQDGKVNLKYTCTKDKK